MTDLRNYGYLPTTVETDAELQAIRRIMEILADFDNPVKYRMLEYLIIRFCGGWRK